MINKGET